MSGLCWNSGISIGGGGETGIYCYDSSPTISNCIITGNRAELTEGSLCFCYGGGIELSGDSVISSPTITNCVINGNPVWGMGGGIYCGWRTSPAIANDSGE